MLKLSCKYGRSDRKSFADIASNTGDYLRTLFYIDGQLGGKASKVEKYDNGKLLNSKIL